MTVTEVGVMGIKPGLNVMNDETPEGQVLIKIWRTVTTAPGGPQNVRWGIENEDPSKIWCFFDWNSVEEHQEFAKVIGEEAVKDIPTIMTHGEFTKHARLTPSTSSLQSPVTEAVVLFFPPDISPPAKAGATAQLQQFIEGTANDGADVTVTSHGWGVENDFPVRGHQGQKGTVLTLFIGFSSLDAHAKFRQSASYQDNLDFITSTEGVLESLVFHMNCRSLDRVAK